MLMPHHRLCGGAGPVFTRVFRRDGEVRLLCKMEELEVVGRSDAIHRHCSGANRGIELEVVHLLKKLLKELSLQVDVSLNLA